MTKKKNLEDKLKDVKTSKRRSTAYDSYAPQTPEEVDDRKERPWAYQAPERYYGPTTPEEVDDCREHPGSYYEPDHFDYSQYKGPDG